MTEPRKPALSEPTSKLNHERIASRQDNNLTCIKDLLSACLALDDALNGVLQMCQSATGAEAAVLLCRIAGGEGATLATGADSFGHSLWPDVSQMMTTPLHVADLTGMPNLVQMPKHAQVYRSLLSIPLTATIGFPMALVLLATRQSAFSRRDYAFLNSVGYLLTQAIERLHRGERTSTPVGNDALGVEAGRKGSHAAITIAYRRIAEWQGGVLDITNALLGVQREAVDGAITAALARTGELANSDRSYVFRLRDCDRLDNTHEWVAPGIEPMIDFLQDMPVELMDEWLSRLEIGQAVEIPDIAALPPDSAVRDVLLMQGIKSLLAVPMIREGKLVGFVGYDAVRMHRRFLPPEIQLLKSVATAINVVMDRTAAEAAADEARAKLQTQRDRLQATLAAIPELVLELDVEGRFLSFNSGAQLVPALNPKTFLGRLPEDVLTEPLVHVLRRLLRSVAERGRPERLDYEMNVNGALRSFHVTATAKCDSGRHGGYVLVVRDVTKERRQQIELLRLSKIAELTSNLVIVTDALGCIDWVNPAFERRTGWKLEEVRGKKPGSFLQTPDTDQTTRRRIGEAIRRGQPVQAELLNRTRSGEEYWVSKDMQPLIGKDGQIEGFVAVQTDITALKKSHQKALRDRAIAMDASIDGIAITDSAGRYTYMNKAHRKMFGIVPKDDIHSFTWQDFCPPSVAASFVAEEWPKLVAEGTWRGELAGVKRNGDLLQNEVSLTLKEDGGLLCIARDIAPRLRASLEQAQLREELQIAQRRETIAHITAGVAHDLNNLVAVVAGAAGLLEMQFATNEQVLTGLSRIRRATEFARDLIAGLGRLGRPETKRATHDLGALMAQGKELLGSGRVEKYAINLARPDDSQSVWTDPTELLQVVVNLALNACEAGAPGTNRVSLEVLAADGTLPSRAADIGLLREDLRYSCFVVSDTGNGVDPEVRKRIFERYFTTKGNAGTGLGMPIVANILESNEAAMWFDSVPAQGTTVTVAWPSCRRNRAQESTAEPCRSGDIDLSGLNILVVDDVADIADVLAEMLEAAGAVSVAISDPTEALLLLSENPGLWAALVTDLHMPKVNGLALADLASRLVPRIPTVLVTALPEMASEHMALFDMVLSKPADAWRLIEAVKSVVSHRQRETEAR